MIGWLVPRYRADVIVVIACCICFPPAVLMLFAIPTSNYWIYAFAAVVLSPVGADALFTVSNLVITNIFAKKDHGLAGVVFNTVAQVGKTFGLALAGVISQSRTRETVAGGLGVGRPVSSGVEYGPEPLLHGYRAAFWFCFGLSLVTLPISFWGLRKVGKVGEKRD